MMLSYFDLYRTFLCAEIESLGNKRILHSLIGELACRKPDAGNPTTKMVIKTCNVPTVPKDCEQFFTSEIDYHGKFEFGYGKNSWCMGQSGMISAIFDTASSNCTMYVSPDCPVEKTALVCTFAIEHASHCGAQCMIHAACLELPKSNERIILHANSGTGKTTLALALAKSGYLICSDDTTLIYKTNGDETFAWGLPKRPKIEPQTKSLLPWIEPLIMAGNPNYRGKHILYRGKMRKNGLLADILPKPVVAVVKLTREINMPCTWQRQDKYQGIMSLIDGNVHFGPDGFFPGHKLRLDLYTAMLSDASPFEMNIGDDLDAAVEAVNEMLHSFHR